MNSVLSVSSGLFRDLYCGSDLVELTCHLSIAALTLKELTGFGGIVIGAVWLAWWYRGLRERGLREGVAELGRALPGENWQFQEMVKKFSQPDLSLIELVFKLAPFARREVMDGVEYVFAVWPVSSSSLNYRAVAVRRVVGFTLPRMGLVRNEPWQFVRGFSSPKWFARNWPDLSQDWKLDCELPEQDVADVLAVLASLAADLDHVWEIHTSGECFACAGPEIGPANGVAAYQAAYRSLEVLEERLKDLPQRRE